jgi:hypothetical protein
MRNSTIINLIFAATLARVFYDIYLTFVEVEINKRNLTVDDCNYLGSLLDEETRNKYMLDQFECDLLITVKTTKKNYQDRLLTLVDTWFGLIKNKVCFLFS